MTAPTRGMCHSVFLLAYSARTKQRASVADWVAAARRVPTFMANALAIESTASLLLDLGLAAMDKNGIHIDSKLIEAGEEASTETFSSIASILLKVRPPSWVRFAIRRGVVAPEFIPTADEEALAWLGDFRNPILLDVASKKPYSDEFRGWLGSLGEHLVIHSEKNLGRNVVHVSKISDCFGYDIESQLGADTRCIEVKTTFVANAGRFFISKNEARRAKELKERWSLVQVIFEQETATAHTVGREYFLSARYIPAVELLNMLPHDTETGTWIEAARIMPHGESWSEWTTKITQSWSYPGFRNDAR